MPHARKVGAENENRAAEFLAAKGYTLVKRNYKKGRSEIDLITMDGDTIVFVEVRARRFGGRETPEESLNNAKLERLWETADLYLAEVGADRVSCRFDIVAIFGAEITHYVDAFRPD